MITENKYIIYDMNDNKYIADIHMGSVLINIYDRHDNIYNLSYLCDNDKINLEMENDKIKNIFVNIKYNFISDSDSDNELIYL